MAVTEHTALFVGGVPRANVAAVARLLNLDERMAIGYERFRTVRLRVEPFMLRSEVFTAPTRHEMRRRPSDLEQAVQFRGRMDAGLTRYVGDAHERYLDDLPTLARRFPGGRFVVVYRPLGQVLAATSDDQQDKVEASWRERVTAVRDLAQAGRGDQLFVVDVNRTGAGDIGHITALWRFLDAEPPDEVHEVLRRAARKARRGADDVPVDRGDELQAWISDRLQEQETA